MLLPPGGNVIEILKSHGRFGKFVELVEFAGLTEELEGGEGEGTPITVLAPTDGAMDNLRDEFKEKIMEDAEDAAVFVRHHVIKVHQRSKVGYPFVQEKIYPTCDPILFMTLI